MPQNGQTDRLIPVLLAPTLGDLLYVMFKDAEEFIQEADAFLDKVKQSKQ